MRVMALLFLLCLCTSSLPAAGDPLPTAKELRDHAAAAAGPGPPDYRETILGTGSLGETKTVTFRDRDDIRRTFERGGYHRESGTYHGEHWQQNYNGLTRVVADDPGNAVKDSVATTVKHVAQPFDAYVVAELNGRGSGTRIYYDATTFLRRRIEDVGATGTVITTFDEFARFGPQTLPLRWTVSSKESQLEMHYQRLEKFPNGATDADVVEASTRRALVEFPPGTNAVNLPVQIVDHAIYVRVNIGSRAVDLELDTGASSIVLDPAFVKDVGLPLTNAVSTVVAGRYTAYTATIPELKIGPLRMHDVVVNVAPMPAVHDARAKPLGLLGFDFLAQLGVTIDYQHGTVQATPAEDFVPPSDSLTHGFDVRLGSGVPMITVSVANAVAERVLFDTGWSGELGFFDFFARRYPGAFRNDLGPAQGYGVGGSFAAEYFQFDDVRLGSLHFQNFRGLRVPGSSYPFDADGVIGNVLLSYFTFDLDYTHGRAYLTPNDTGKKIMHLLR